MYVVILTNDPKKYLPKFFYPKNPEIVNFNLSPPEKKSFAPPHLLPPPLWAPHLKAITCKENCLWY